MRRVLGIMANDFEAVFQHAVARGFKEVALQRGYLVEPLELPEPPASLEAIPHRLEHLAGVLCIATVLPDKVLEALFKMGVSLSLVSHQAANVSVPSVFTNNVQGMSLLMTHLIETCGCHQPLFICGNMRQLDAQQRKHAFTQELMRHNLKLRADYYLPGEFVPEQAAASLTGFIERGLDFDAIVASDYLMALTALDVLRPRGLSVPDDVAVVGFGDGSEAAEAGLTTVAADVVEQGRRSARQLIGQVEGMQMRGQTLLSTDLVLRVTA